MASVTKRLLPSVVDRVAATEPDRVFFSVPRTIRPEDGFHDINAHTFARAVDRCAWFIENNIGRGQDFPTLTYLGPQDLVYGILLLASIKTGYKLLLNSPRNSLEAHMELLEKTQCNTFLLPRGFALPVIEQILSERRMDVVNIPGLQHWIHNGDEQPYTYVKSFEGAKLEPFAVLHTSGSTGIPKPVILTHATVAVQDALADLPSLGLELGFPAMCKGKRLYLAFPLFHCAGLLILLASIYGNYTVVLGPFPASADVIDAVHVHGNVQHSFIPPASLIDLVKDPEYLDNLGLLEQVTTGGGTLPTSVGDLVSSRTRLLNSLGSTECGSLPSLLCDTEDWAYIRNSPMLGDEFRKISEELYEHVIVRQPKYEAYQGIFGTFPDLTEWSMKDLYSKHPTKDNLWLHRGRADDIIVFSTGEKLNPIDMENIISSNPSVRSALVTGIGQFQSSLIVEATNPPTNLEERISLLTEIWPSVEIANKKSPSHARIQRNMILFTTTTKPMLRAGKGTVQRQLTIKMYRDELSALYEANKEVISLPAAAGVNISNGVSHAKNTNGIEHDGERCVAKDESDIFVNLNQIIAEIAALDINQLSPNANLFELGLDSLHVISITKTINKIFSDRDIQQRLQTKDIYANPSISSLQEALFALVVGKILEVSPKSDEQEMQRLFARYATNISISARKPDPNPLNEAVVLLTGSTGSLGSYILDSLVGNAAVKYVYCLNRGPDSSRRQHASQSKKELESLPEALEFLEGDLSKPYFGLTLQQYRKLLQEVTIVIHNAWQVDFNLNVETFAHHIRAIKRFADFSTESRCGARICFISSISAVGRRTHDMLQSTPISESMFEGWDTPEPTGYGQSKYLAERVLDNAARQAGVPVQILRVGQIAGPTTNAGVWPKQEWLPSLVASSLFLGILPQSLGQLNIIDWIPVNDAGRCIVELATSTSAVRSLENCAKVYHVVNPRKSSWENLASIFQECLNEKTSVELVPLGTWVEALRKSASVADSENASQNPAVKLLDFFEGIVSESAYPLVLDTQKAVAASPTLAGLNEIQDWHIKNWVRQWRFASGSTAVE